MNVTFRQLRLFLALADTGSVSAAARLLHVTQPTASMQLRQATRAIGVSLYEVIARRVHLTEAGRELARTARSMAADWAAFEQQIDAMRGLTRGRLSVAVVSTAEYFVPRLLGTFCASHPDVDLSLEVLNRDGVVRRLHDNLDDLYVMSRPPADARVHREPFLPNPLVVVAAASHPLATRRRMRLSELAGTRFILRERGSGTRLAVDAHFRRSRFKPDVRLELGSNEAIREAVAGNLGIAVLSAHALPDRPEGHGLAVLNVAGFPISSAWYVVYPRAKQLSPIATVFREHLLGTARDARPAPGRLNSRGGPA
jgi:DNA-binding transcriptional LysR family regulator